MPEIMRSFKSVYPEAIDVQIKKFASGKGIVEATLPGDGTFFFVVTRNSVSRSYDTIEEASNTL